MQFIADFHIHSHFSMATSKSLIPELLEWWARVKGVTVVGTGDLTHPGWVAELQQKLTSAEQGLFALRKSYEVSGSDCGPLKINPTNAAVRFVLTGEVSTIYKKGGRVRKVHSLIFVPDFGSAKKIQHELSRLGVNIEADGRPTVGLDVHDLLEIVLHVSDSAFLIPAHIWTPWFSVLGSKSGFDSIEECFGDLTPHIFALETGLSSDPPMNWRLSSLDKYTLISNSDAHSPEKMGRNATSFDTNLSYADILAALKSPMVNGACGTIDLFPQEGKYYHDGHRKCGVNWHPKTTVERGGVCPVCQKMVTVGVLHRVNILADRADGKDRKNRLPYRFIVPLREVLSGITGFNPSSRKIGAIYATLIDTFGTELDILLNHSPGKIASSGYPALAEAITRIRSNEVDIIEGFDGEYGKINFKGVAEKILP